MFELTIRGKKFLVEESDPQKIKVECDETIKKEYHSLNNTIFTIILHDFLIFLLRRGPGCGPWTTYVHCIYKFQMSLQERDTKFSCLIPLLIRKNYFLILFS